MGELEGYVPPVLSRYGEFGDLTGQKVDGFNDGNAQMSQVM